MRPSTPLITVDAIIELIDYPGRPIVLIERLNPPHGWAIPGGFVDIGETLEAAVVREALEETSLNINIKTLLGCYSEPERDSRGHTVSIVYVAEAKGQPVAQDDAKALDMFDIHGDLPELAFDHAKVLADYKDYLSGKRSAPVIPAGC